MLYNYEKIVNPSNLETEIIQSDISIVLVGITVSTDTNIEFKVALSIEEKAILDNIVQDHDASIPSPVSSLSVTVEQPKDLSGRPIFTTSSFSDASGFRFRGASFKDTVLANTTKDIDYKLEHERYINGGRAIIDNIGDNDTVTFQVVDKDNILGFGVGVVLDEFITDYYIPQDGSLEIKLDYPAKIMAGLYIRLKYTSTHSSGCTLKCNLYLHWKAV